MRIGPAAQRRWPATTSVAPPDTEWVAFAADRSVSARWAPVPLMGQTMFRRSTTHLPHFRKTYGHCHGWSVLAKLVHLSEVLEQQPPPCVRRPSLELGFAAP